MCSRNIIEAPPVTTWGGTWIAEDSYHKLFFVGEKFSAKVATQEVNSSELVSVLCAV